MQNYFASFTGGSSATLIVQEDDQTRTIALGNRPITLGRAPGNDIVLRSRFVSSRHARIEPDGPVHSIVDLESTNGLLYAGKRVVERHTLRNGDLVRIGDLATGSFVTLTYRNQRAAAAMPRADVARHSYPIDPANEKVSIGRESCDITLESPQVSRLHAWLRRTPDGDHILHDAESSNGTFVNGERISEHTLRLGDMIQIGSYRLVYRVTSLDEYDQQGALRLDARAIVRDVPRGKGTRRLLHDISLSIAPRELVAVVGSSGSGKSTLLKALSGYERASSGQVLVNGDDFYRNFALYRPILGYVPQDDILHTLLSAEGALGYIARLRLPDDTTPAELQQRIAQVLEDVEMEDHSYKQISRLSGGQRKRVSISSELLSNPSLFFLDEPTSGLDPGLERKMMYTLRRLADNGRIIVIVTHATENIRQCDLVIFIAAGHLVFFGPPDQALTFFGITSGDFADIYTRLEGDVNPQSALVQGDLNKEWQDWQQANPDAASPPPLAVLWAAHYRTSSHYRRYVLERLNQTQQVGQRSAKADQREHIPRLPFLRQMAILLTRSFELVLSERAMLPLLLLQAPILALLLLLLLPNDALLGAEEVGLIQRAEAVKLLFMLTIASVWIGLINAARSIASEVPIYRHERLVGLRISSYVGSKAAMFGLLTLGQTIVLLLILGVGVQIPGGASLVLPLPLEIFVTLLLATLAALAHGLAISASAPSANRALALVPIVLMLHVVLGGQVFPLDNPVSQAFSRLTITRQALDALGTSLNLNTFCDLPNVPSEEEGIGRPPPGCSLAALRNRPDRSFPGAFRYRGDHLLLNWGILLAHVGAGLGLTFWLLQRKDSRPMKKRKAQTKRVGQPAEAPAASPVIMTHEATVLVDETASPSRVAAAQATVRMDEPETDDGAATEGPAQPQPVAASTGRMGAPQTALLSPDELEFDPPTAPVATPEGVRINRYLVEDNLGSRGMFTVYRAYDSQMRRQVAIKVLQEAYCNPLTSERFREEAGLIATLEHPCVVRVYDSGEDADQPFVVMQYMPGGTLEQRMAQGKLSLQDAAPIIERVAQALDAAHARTIFHHNLKPANILFNERGQALLSDFGIVVGVGLISDLTGRGIFDANYLSPEQVRTILEIEKGLLSDEDLERTLVEPVTAQSDIYALGTIAFHVLTGQPPYQADTPHATALNHLQQPVPTLRLIDAGLPDAVQAVFERVLAKDPAARYATASEFARELQHLATGRRVLSQIYDQLSRLPASGVPGTRRLEEPPESTGVPGTRRLEEPPESTGGAPTTGRLEEPPEELGGAPGTRRLEEPPEQPRGAPTTRRLEEPPESTGGAPTTGRLEEPSEQPREAPTTGRLEASATLRLPDDPDAPHVGRYLVNQELGQGAMGVVYLAYDPYMSRRVAIKMLPKELKRQPESLVNFRREAETVAALEHECIVQIYDLGEHEEQPFLVLQYMSGGTLADRLASGPLTLQQAVPVIERVARGLDAAHERSIIHQDIKPANILFDEEDSAFISDFGIAVVAKASASVGSPRATGGTPAYMSPEQAQAFAEPDAPASPLTSRSDIYSLGVMLFHVLAGQPPYQGATLQETAWAHLAGSVPRIQDVNPTLPGVVQGIIDRAIARNPDDRYPNAQELARDVRDMVRGRWFLRNL